MPNDNHEYLNNVPICTYTDAITSENPMSESDVYNCVLSAGIPYDRAASAWMKNENLAALNEPNSNNPWENGETGRMVIHDTSALISIPSDNPESYFKIMYGTAGVNATELSVKKYRNVLSITPHTKSLNGQTITYYSWSITTQYGENNTWNNSALLPYRIVTAGGKPCKMTLSGNHEILYGYSEFSAFGGRTAICHYDYNIPAATDGTTNKPSNAPYIKNSDWDYVLRTERDVQIYNDTYFTRYLQGINYGGGGGFHAYGAVLISSIDYLLMLCALCGLKFRYNNTDYKPIVSGGVVTGYTDDMSSTSEWDAWETINDHTIPVTPPAPPAPDKHDNEIEMDLSHYSTLNGFIQYYLMGISTVDDLAAAMNRFDITLIGKDLLPNLISYKMFAIPAANFSTGTTRTITIAGHEMKKVNDDPIQAPIVLDITPITLDTITIPHTYNDFRDYDPFTKIEMFVPFCGWFTLPPWCMGRAISGTMYIDLPNGTVKAVIKASQTVVAEIGGSCAVDVPFVAQSVGSKTAAVISNMANGLIATADPTPQSFVSSSMGIATALNRNYTQCKGVMGDGSNVQGLNRIYIKVTRPAPTETLNGEISARYKHERGLPCGKFLTLAKGDGFTQITDANINGTMTAREKQMIIDGFRHGLIL